MKLFVERRKRINESLDSPCEGIFWVIDGNLIAYTEQVDTSGKYSTTLEHKDIWGYIKEQYKVDGKTVSYDYFPRGCVMVNPKTVDGKFDHYDVFIYIDACINNNDCLNDIYYEFRLNKNCLTKYIVASGGVTSNHYVCHNCNHNIPNPWER